MPKADSAAADTSTEGWFEYPFSHKNFPEDFSFLLDAPAGKRGFMKAKEDGHFYFEDGTRAKFWGTNIATTCSFPDKAAAFEIARTLSRAGYNAVRLHLLESEAPKGIIKRGAARSWDLDAEYLDRLDFFIAELKKRGIYTTVELMPMCDRKFAAEDGVPEREKLNKTQWGAKGLSFFDKDVIEVGKNYAKAFLSHVNPYTKLSYAEEPAIALYELTNEDTLFYFFVMSRAPEKERFYSQLNKMWNEWLLAKYGSREKLAGQWTDCAGRQGLKTDEDPAKGTVRMPPLNAFYLWRKAENYTETSGAARINEGLLFITDISSRHYTAMIEYLKGIGVKAPVSVSNVVWHQAGLKADSATDFIDDHAYFDHPMRGRLERYKPGDPRGPWHIEQKFNDEQMTALDPAKNKRIINGLSFGRLAGKPMVTTEWGLRPPNNFLPDGDVSCAAYSCLQDYDALFHFAYAGGYGFLWSDFKENKKYKALEITNPSAVAFMPVCSAIYLRGDAAQPKTLSRSEYPLLTPLTGAAGDCLTGRLNIIFLTSQRLSINFSIKFIRLLPA